jgi:hypothetical protein
LYAISYLIILFLLKEEHLINSVNKIFITKKNV